MIATPFLVNLGEWWIKHCEQPKDDSDSMHEVPGEISDHVILAGFGRVGQRIASLMDVAKIPYVARDNNQAQVINGRDMGFPVYFGDARRMEVLKAAGAGQARMLLVSLDNAEYAEQLVTQVRQHYPFLPIHARARDRDHCQTLLLIGSNNVVLETLEASLRLGELVLLNNGFNQKRTLRLLHDYRQDYYTRIKEDARNKMIDV